MSTHVGAPKDEIVAFCERCHVTEFAFFGSVLREDPGPHGDIGALVHFAPDAWCTLMHFVRQNPLVHGYF